MLAAAYELVNTDSKWQDISEPVLRDIGFYAHSLITQLCLYFSPHGTTLFLPKIGDDIIICVPPKHFYNIMKKLEDKSIFGTISNLLGTLRLFGSIVVQYENFNLSIDGEEKQNALVAISKTRNCRFGS